MVQWTSPCVPLDSTTNIPYAYFITDLSTYLSPHPQSFDPLYFLTRLCERAGRPVVRSTCSLPLSVPRGQAGTLGALEALENADACGSSVPPLRLRSRVSFPYPLAQTTRPSAEVPNLSRRPLQILPSGMVA